MSLRDNAAIVYNHSVPKNTRYPATETHVRHPDIVSAWILYLRHVQGRTWREIAAKPYFARAGVPAGSLATGRVPRKYWRALNIKAEPKRAPRIAVSKVDPERAARSLINNIEPDVLSEIVRLILAAGLPLEY